MIQGIWLVATEPLTVQGRSITTGEAFYISRTQSGALLVQGRATIQHPQPGGPRLRKPDPPAPKRRGRPRKSPPATVVEGADDPEGVTRRYQRRDLQADE